jgi:hypothetical protein
MFQVYFLGINCLWYLPSEYNVNSDGKFSAIGRLVNFLSNFILWTIFQLILFILISKFCYPNNDIF